MKEQPQEKDAKTRRLFGLGVFGLLAAAYGTLAAFMGRFLYPAKPLERDWMYVAGASAIETGRAMVFRTPGGAAVNIARQGQGDDTIVALSSTCPHLGCQVHWEPQNDRFFCPCHNGIFDPAGVATAGPPADAGQSLLQYPVKVDSGVLFIELPTAEIALGPGRLEEPEILMACSPRGPGQDPCLFSARA